MAAVGQDRWWEALGEPRNPEDRWVAATETRPAPESRRVIHHATTYLFQKESPSYVALRDSRRDGQFRSSGAAAERPL